MMEVRKIVNWPVVGALAAFMLFASFLRFRDLGYASMIADVMEYYKVAQAEVPPFELLMNPTAFGLTGLWGAAHNLFFRIFPVDVNFYNIRIVDVVTGVLTIPALFLLASRLGGKRVGLLAAFFIAIHPIHVQMSRESYTYVAVVLGAILSLIAVVRLQDSCERGKSPGFFFYMASFLGVALTTMNVTPWPFAAVASTVLFSQLIYALKSKKLSWSPFVIVAGGFILVSIPILFKSGSVQWAFEQLFRLNANTEESQFWQEIMGRKVWADFLRDSLVYLQGYLYGTGRFRSTVNIILIALAGWRLRSLAGADPRWRIFIGMFVATLLLMIGSLFRADQVLALRLYCPLFPFFAIWTALAVEQMARLMKRWMHQLGGVELLGWVLGYGLLVAGFLSPALIAAKAEGHQPYLRVAQWADANLPAGTLIQCDRWLSPWNELRVNASTNMIYTFLFPNAPLSVYEKSQWRDSLMKYLKDNPFAAYFEQKEHWGRAGPWIEPQSLFAHSQTFSDSASIQLNAVGLAYRGVAEVDNLESKVTFTLYYNTTEDVVYNACSRGEKTLVKYETGWRYLKPWNQLPGFPESLLQLIWIQAGMLENDGVLAGSVAALQRFSREQVFQYMETGRWADYFLATKNSELSLFNLTDQPMDASLAITAVPLTGSVSIGVADRSVIFPSRLLTQKRVPVRLQPGKNVFRVAVPANHVFMVRSIKVLDYLSE